MPGRHFMDLLHARWTAGHLISVGLDPEPSRLPGDLHNLDADEAIVRFLREVIIATADVAAAYKPNAAHYEALGEAGHRTLRRVVETVHELAPEVPVIFDAKRADIGATNEKYAHAAFDVLGFDAITVHPYLGPEAMQPFLERDGKGVFVLARNSNPGAGHYQDLMVEGVPLYRYIARDVAHTWNANGNCGLVVAATYPEEMREVREAAPDLPFLVPGIGIQGGDVAATIRNGGHALLLHASRSLNYAFETGGGDVLTATRSAATALQEEITSARSSLLR